MPSEAGQRQRDAALADMQKRGITPMPDAPTHVKTVGVTFVQHYPQNMLDLQRMIFEWPSDEPCTAVLIRNPNNQFDDQAIEVHVPALGDRGMMGHLPKTLAARIAPEMDAGVEWAAHVHEILVLPSKPYQPGCELVIQRVQNLPHFVGDGTGADDLGGRGSAWSGDYDERDHMSPGSFSVRDA